MCVRSLSQVSFTDTCRLRLSSLCCMSTRQKRRFGTHKCGKKGLRKRRGLITIWHTGEQPVWPTCEWIITSVLRYTFRIHKQKEACKRDLVIWHTSSLVIWHTSSLPHRYLTYLRAACVARIWVEYNFGIAVYMPYTQTERGLQTKLVLITISHTSEQPVWFQCEWDTRVAYTMGWLWSVGSIKL